MHKSFKILISLPVLLLLSHALTGNAAVIIQVKDKVSAIKAETAQIRSKSNQLLLRANDSAATANIQLLEISEIKDAIEPMLAYKKYHQPWVDLSPDGEIAILEETSNKEQSTLLEYTDWAEHPSSTEFEQQIETFANDMNQLLLPSTGTKRSTVEIVSSSPRMRWFLLNRQLKRMENWQAIPHDLRQLQRKLLEPYHQAMPGEPSFTFTDDRAETWCPDVSSPPIDLISYNNTVLAFKQRQQTLRLIGKWLQQIEVDLYRAYGGQFSFYAYNSWLYEVSFWEAHLDTIVRTAGVMRANSIECGRMCADKASNYSWCQSNHS